MPENTSQTAPITSKTVTCVWCRQKNRLYKQATQGVYKCGNCQKQLPNPFGSFTPPPQPAEKSSKTFGFAILAGVVLAGVGLLSFSVQLLSNREQGPPVASTPETASPFVKSPVNPSPSKPVSISPLPSPSVILQNRSLPSSKVLVPLATNGDGSLKISNGTNRDAYVKLVDPAARKLIAALYVKKNTNLKLEQIPDGTYEVLFVTGEDWDGKTKSFTRSGGFSRFDKSLNFVTTQSDTEIRYTIMELTLNPVVNGNVTLSGVNEQEFDQYE